VALQTADANLPERIGDGMRQLLAQSTSNGVEAPEAASS
jgi:hypothetical protein